MSGLAREAAEIVDALPPDKAEAVVEFARYLAEKADEEEWDRQFADPKYRSKFGALVDQAKADVSAGKAEPFDPDAM
jgi:hypothetical protein